MAEKTVIMDAQAISRAITRISFESATGVRRICV